MTDTTQADSDHVREEFFTVDGGYVLLQRAHEGYDLMAEGESEPVRRIPAAPLRFACTAGDNDLGVALEPQERMRLARWLIEQTLDADDFALVNAAMLSTSWHEQTGCPGD